MKTIAAICAAAILGAAGALTAVYRIIGRKLP